VAPIIGTSCIREVLISIDAAGWLCWIDVLTRLQVGLLGLVGWLVWFGLVGLVWFRWLVGWLVVGWLAGWLVGWLVG